MVVDVVGSQKKAPGHDLFFVDDHFFPLLVYFIFDFIGEAGFIILVHLKTAIEGIIQPQYHLLIKFRRGTEIVKALRTWLEGQLYLG